MTERSIQSGTIPPTPSSELDFTACDREPIQIPGAIQPHGFLLGLDTQGLVMLASSTAATFLQRPLSQVFGRPLSDLLPSDLPNPGPAGPQVSASASARDGDTQALLDGAWSLGPRGDAAAGSSSGLLLPGITLRAEDGSPVHFEVVAHTLPAQSGLGSASGAAAAVHTIYEFEQLLAPPDLITDARAINAQLYNFVAAIRTLRSTADICRETVAQIRRLTGCDRVVLYQFDRDGHGVVLAEELASDSFASYLGLHFPASDVPAQARLLYKINRVRIIPSVDYDPSPLYFAPSGVETPRLAPDIDLSQSILRSVSPIHRQYMRNMGTFCSMSVSLLVEDQLWGLVSCHHHQPRYVPLRLRSACDFVAQIAASQIESQQNAHRLEQALQARAIQGRLLASMSAASSAASAAASAAVAASAASAGGAPMVDGKSPYGVPGDPANAHSYMDSLAANPELLMSLVHADGAAILVGGSVSLFGITPSQDETLQIVEWLRRGQSRRRKAVPSDRSAESGTAKANAPTVQTADASAAQSATLPNQLSSPDEFFATDSLGSLYAPAKAFAARASGVLAIAVSKLHNTRVLWFRQELVETVRWAGNPSKPGEAAGPENPVRIDPRHSFEEWLQHVRGTAAPWSDQELEAAREFRSAVLEVVLRRAEEIAELAAGLQVANQELEAFSYSVSHDLRAPFRHISAFSEMLQEEQEATLTDKGRHYLSTIMESARFAGMLVDSLLDFSRFARSTVSMSPLDMEQLVDSEWQATLADETAQNGRTVQFSRSSLPTVLADAALLRQVLRNLFSNAIKYTQRQPNPVVRFSCALDGRQFVFSIADNGVGFDQQYSGKLFGVFQRLHRVEDFEGTGIGLANVRRIIGRHGGKVWAEGKLDQGATFYFTLPAVFPEKGTKPS